MKNTKKIAVIFDMDGVIIDNYRFHHQSWVEFCKKYKFNYSEDLMKTYMFGRTNDEIIPVLFKKENMPQNEISALGEEKEIIYRSIIEKELAPMSGLEKFIEELKNNQIPIAVGSSGPRSNVNFILEKTGLKPHFDAIVDAQSVTNGKPHPEIFLTAAQNMNAKPETCIVFEDTNMGIEAARRAGMKVVGVASTHPANQLNKPDMVIQNFEQITLSDIEQLLKLNN